MLKRTSIGLGLVCQEFSRRFMPVHPEWFNGEVNWGGTEDETIQRLAELKESDPFFAILHEYFSRPGKNLRPLLMLCSYLMVASGYRERELTTDFVSQELANISPYTWELASAWERFHNAGLALDDVFDNASHRRGGISLATTIRNYYRAYRSDSSRFVDWSGEEILRIVVLSMFEVWEALYRASGHSQMGTNLRKQKWELLERLAERNRLPLEAPEILGLLFELIEGLRADYRCNYMLGVQKTLLEECVSTFEATLHGESIDLSWSQLSFPRVDQVFALQFLKTTRYSVSFPVKAGALLAQQRYFPEDPFRHLDEMALEAYCRSYGEAFQIYDDLLILSSKSRSGKSCHADLENGSFTTVTVGTRSLLEPADQIRWPGLLQQARTSIEARDEALRLMRQSGIVESCRQMIEQRLNDCDEALDILECRYDTSILRQMAREAVGWMDDGVVDIFSGPEGRS